MRNADRDPSLPEALLELSGWSLRRRQAGRPGLSHSQGGFSHAQGALEQSWKAPTWFAETQQRTDGLM